MTVEIPVWRRGFPIRLAVIDDDDAELVLSIERWGLVDGYAARFVGNRNVYMHRLILGLAPYDRFVHHLNEDKLDNRRENLVICASRSEANRMPHPKRDAISRIANRKVAV